MKSLRETVLHWRILPDHRNLYGASYWAAQSLSDRAHTMPTLMYMFIPNVHVYNCFKRCCILPELATCRQRLNGCKRISFQENCTLKSESQK